MSGMRLQDGGNSIDRGQPLRFSFDGRPMSGFAGDSVASALLANGVSVVGRSFIARAGSSRPVRKNRTPC